MAWVPGETLLIKIWESLVDNGLGQIFKPWQIRRIGRAETDVQVDRVFQLAQAEQLAAEIRAGRKKINSKRQVIEYLPSGALPTLSAQDIGQQALDLASGRAVVRLVNLSRIVQRAMDEAAQEQAQPISDQPADPDWLARWRAGAEDVSSERIQQLWARILAGEVRQPGSFSLHTIAFLSRMSQSDAELIEDLARFSVEGLFFRFGPVQELFERRGLPYERLLILQDLGIISEVDLAGGYVKVLAPGPDEHRLTLVNWNKTIVIEWTDQRREAITIHSFPLTQVGTQMITLIRGLTADDEYLQIAARHFEAMGLRVWIGDWNADLHAAENLGSGLIA